MSAAPTDYRLGYRADIEGLRAVAILLVVCAHAHIAHLAGGFIGVDVFFVLSGYLITGLLVTELRASGTIDFAGFYARRLRRLLPGLLLMLVCTGILGRLLLAPGAQPEQASAAGSAALWVSNFFFAFANLDYFSPGSESNLFLHTWSLGVEEQFYLVWPLLLVLATGAWHGARHVPAFGRVILVMPLVLALSLAGCAYWALHDPQLAFYMMPARAWQFALGALVFAFYGTPKTGTARIATRRRWLQTASWLGWFGLAAIVGTAVALDGDMTYPWPWALIPSLGAAAVLATGAAGTAKGAAAVLAWRPLQGIGRVSYSWYLWHWPVLLLGATVVNTHSLIVRLAFAVVSLVAAIASYRWFESPIRRSRSIVRRPRVAVVAAVVLMALAGFSGTTWNERALAAMHRPEQMRLVSLVFDAPIIYGMGCDDWYGTARVNPCSFGPSDAPRTAVLIGDSIAMQWFPAVKKIFTGPEWRLVALTKSACPMVDAPIFYKRIHREYTECAQWRTAALRYVASLKPDTILLGSSHTYDFSQIQWTQGTESVLGAISSASKQIFVLRSTPTLPFDAPSCLAPRSEVYRALAGDNGCSASAIVPSAEAVYGALSAAAKPFDNVRMIDLNDNVCPNRICKAEREGIVVFRDNHHLTTRFVGTLTPVLAGALGMRSGSVMQVLAADPTTAPTTPQPTP